MVLRNITQTFFLVVTLQFLSPVFLDPDSPFPRDTATSGPRCPAYEGLDESYEATLLKHGPGSTFCTASRHKNQSLPFRSTLVAPAFCSQPIHMHKNVGDACYNWAKSNYYPLTEANTLGISGPHRRWHGDRSRLRAAIGSAMEGKPIHIAVLGCSFTEGRGCAPRWFNGTKINRVTWPDRLESMLKWMFPKTSSVHVNQYNVMGGTSFNALRNLPKSSADPNNIYIVDLSPNDFNPKARGKGGVAAVTANLVKEILELPNAPALIYVETMGYKAAPFCRFHDINKCDLDFEKGFKPYAACIGRKGCDFGDFTAKGCMWPCLQKMNWVPPKKLLRECPDSFMNSQKIVKGSKKVCDIVPYPVPEHLGDNQQRKRREYVEWWLNQMWHGRTVSEARNWACEPGAAAGNIHMASLEHYHIPVVSMQDATCDFERCGPLSPQRYPLWGKGNAHTDCLPTHQIIADLVAGLFAAEALAECSDMRYTAIGEDTGVSTAAVLSQGTLGANYKSGLETCNDPLFSIDANNETHEAEIFKAVRFGNRWLFGEDVKGKFGWIYLKNRALMNINSTVSVGSIKPHRLVVELPIKEGIVVVEYMSSYEGFGNAKCWFELIEPLSDHEEHSKSVSKHRRPDARMLQGHWDAHVSLTDHESFVGFWPPGRWAMYIEPANDCAKFKLVNVESC